MNIFELAELGVSGWKQKIDSPVWVYLSVLLTNVFTLRLKFDQMTFFTSVLAGLYVVAVYFSHRKRFLAVVALPMLSKLITGLFW